MRRPQAPTSPRSRAGRAIAATGAALLLVAGVQAFAPAAQAASVEPTLLEGNVKCSGKTTRAGDSLGYDHGYKIDKTPTDEVIDTDDFDVEIYDTDAEGTTFSFKDADPAVLAVIVKTGKSNEDGDKSYVYTYGSPVSGDTALTSAPKQISHIEFCWDDGGEGEDTTIAKLWFDSEEELLAEDPADSDIVITVVPDEGENITLDHDDLTDGDGIAEVEIDPDDVDSVDETTVPEGWDEFECPQQYTDDADYVFCNKEEVTTRDTDITVKKVWFDRDGDEVDAPTDSDIVITVDVTEGTDETLEHDDLDDGVVTVAVSPTNVTGVDETTVPDGWDEIACAAQYEDDADYVFCNRRESSNRSRGGGGGTTTTTTTTIVTEVLPFTAEPEVAPEVLPETLTTAAPQLPFTGSGTTRLAAVALALLAIGATLVTSSRRREVVD